MTMASFYCSIALFYFVLQETLALSLTNTRTHFKKTTTDKTILDKHKSLLSSLSFSSPYILFPQEKESTPNNDNPWKIFLPPIIPSIPSPQLGSNANNNNIDVTVQWDSTTDSNKEIAKTMINFILKQKEKGVTAYSDDDSLYGEQLANSMDIFVSFCQEYLIMNELVPTKFKARIVITRGSDGTKCPQWHYDHVPVRWIQSLVGPGCDYVAISNENNNGEEQQQQTGINWKEFQYNNDETNDDNMEDDNNQDSMIDSTTRTSANDRRVDPAKANICQVATGQAILLLGSLWNIHAKRSSTEIPAPAIHKSPTIPFWQGRVLLTMDVIS